MYEFFPDNDMIPLSDDEFRAIRTLVFRQFGISIPEHKRGLVIGRLQKILRQRGLRSFGEYHDLVVADSTDAMLGELANKITTNHTFFFREPGHFDFFRSDILPWMTAEHRRQRSNDLRIWCAAAASGEEAYTIAISLLEYFGADYRHWDCGVLATDISENVLQTARQGVYDPARLHDVPPSIIKKYFNRTPTGYEVVDRVKKEVTIRRFNLMNKKYPFQKPFDCIWCRNVMIYFNNATKYELAEKLYDQTVPGGYLLVGHSETLSREQTRWKYIKPAVYRRED